MGDRTCPRVHFLSSKGIICSSREEFLQGTYSLPTLREVRLRRPAPAFPVRQHLTDGLSMVGKPLYRRRQLVSTRVAEILAKSFLPGAKAIHATGFQCGILQDGIAWAWDF
jgi:hypothetical protein